MNTIIKELSDCCGAEIQKSVVGHNWNFKHPGKWEMAHYYCSECENEVEEPS